MSMGTLALWFILVFIWHSTRKQRGVLLLTQNTRNPSGSVKNDELVYHIFWRFFTRYPHLLKQPISIIAQRD